MGRLVLIRHTQVALHWKGRCYGRADAGLSSAGRLAAKAIAHSFEPREGTIVIASPLRRARFLGVLLARKTGSALAIEPALAECHFGSWEGQPWDGIYADSGDAIMGLITAPDTFRPGGGETTFELRDRVMAWYESLARHEADIVAVAHGGPIAALRGTLAGAPVSEWPALVPAYGEIVELRCLT